MEGTSVQEKPCVVTNHKYYNKAKEIIYIQEYDIQNVEQFKTDLQENYEITNVIKALFTKTRTEETTAFLITFSAAVLPETIYIPRKELIQ